MIPSPSLSVFRFALWVAVVAKASDSQKRWNGSASLAGLRFRGHSAGFCICPVHNSVSRHRSLSCFLLLTSSPLGATFGLVIETIL